MSKETDGHKRLFRDSEKIERSSQLLWFGADCVCLKGQRWVSLRRAVSSLCPPGRTSFHCGFDTTVTSSNTHTHRQTDSVSVCWLMCREGVLVRGLMRVTVLIMWTRRGPQG